MKKMYNQNVTKINSLFLFNLFFFERKKTGHGHFPLPSNDLDNHMKNPTRLLGQYSRQNYSD